MSMIIYDDKYHDIGPYIMIFSKHHIFHAKYHYINEIIKLLHFVIYLHLGLYCILH